MKREKVPEDGLSASPASVVLESFNELEDGGAFVDREMGGGTLEDDELEEPIDSVIGFGTVVDGEVDGFGLGAPSEITGGPLDVGVFDGAFEIEIAGADVTGGGPDELSEIDGPLEEAEEADAGGVVGREVVLFGFEIISSPIIALLGLDVPCDIDAEGGLLGVVRSIAPRSTASMSPPALLPAVGVVGPEREIVLISPLMIQYVYVIVG